jgi:hypothetical protein
MSFTIVPNSATNIDQRTLDYIQFMVRDMLYSDFHATILVDYDSIMRVFQRMLLDRREPLNKIAQRTIMEIVNEFKTQELERVRALRWESDYENSKQLYNNRAKMGGDWTMSVSKQPATLQFYHTFYSAK